jgi:hypothetical protein
MNAFWSPFRKEICTWIRNQFSDSFVFNDRDHEKANLSPATTGTIHSFAAAALVDLSSAARAYSSQPILFLDSDDALFVCDLDYDCRSKP